MQLIATKGRVTARTRDGRTKPVSDATMEKRENDLFRALNELQAMGHHFKSLSALKRKHVEALVEKWMADGLSPSTLQNRISMLRTLADWLGKRGMVGSSESFVPDASYVKRSTNATRDHSWSAAGVDTERMLAMVSTHDRYVGMQLRLCHAFFLRVQEAVMFRPYQADKGHYLMVRDGTKGGRERSVQIETPYQREVLEQAKDLVNGVTGYVGHPDLTLAQALRRVTTVCTRFGLTRNGLGVTPHGLRHEGLNDLFEKVAGVPSPVRSGDAAQSVLATVDKATLDLARSRVSEAAGHARLSISGAYIGGLLGRKRTLSPHEERQMKDWTRFFELQGMQYHSAQEQAEMEMLRTKLMRVLQNGTPSEATPPASDTDGVDCTNHSKTPAPAPQE